MNAAILTSGLSRRFGRSEAVHDLNLAVPVGSIFGFIGPNGAGKTTTIKLLMNILEPSNGTAEVLTVPSRSLGPDDFRRIGYVSENQELPGWMTVNRFLRYCRSFYPNWDEELEVRLLRRFNLPGQRRLKNLSRGMRMKAALISSIAYRPKLLILDEPFSGLDPLVRDELIEAILELAAETEWTVFVSSHDLSELESVVSHVGYIEQGRLQFSEELTSVQARFREVEITGPAEMPVSWPTGWLRPATSGAVTRFVVSTFAEERTPEQIESFFPDCRAWEARPMSLRAIFTSMASADGRERTAL
ncbi:MAG TPA: ABC transporter ATP-binding protein [Bryobacteraceae bacterium]|jgi:ABC-2 type transport system ATP-binding protein|nr:ABC transporter ATP-binding protein [Bryobacteraceae bacterium]